MKRIALVFLECIAVCVAATKTKYIVGGWQSQDAATVTKMIAPIFQDYLTETVGKTLTPPAQFIFKPVDLDEASDSRAMIASGELDMIYTTAGSLTCKAAEFAWIPLATQRNMVGSGSTGSDGIVIFSRLDNSAITKTGDLNGKTIGCGFLFSVSTYLYGYQLLLEQGIHMFRDLAQVRFYGSNFEAYYQAVLSGELDAGFAGAAWLAKNHAQDMPRLRVLHRQENLTYEGQPFPAVTSSLVAAYGVAVSNQMPWGVKGKVLRALEQLDASDAGMQALGVSGWTSAGSYSATLTALESAGVLYQDDSGAKRCRDAYLAHDIWESIDCPADHYKVDFNTSARQCALAGRACPAGATCFCRPCQRKPQNLFSWETVVGLCVGLYSVALAYFFLGPLQRRVESLLPGAGGPDVAKGVEYLSPQAGSRRDFSPGPRRGSES